MRTLATKQPIKEDSAKQDRTRSPLSVNGLRSNTISPLSTGMPLLQRQCACGGGCPRCQDNLTLQTKLKISEPGDVYEQEADRVADEVMRMPEPTIQRQMEPEEGDEEIVQTKAISNSITPLQRSSSDPNQSAEVPDIVHDVLRSPGQPLDSVTQTSMESRFGHDFSQVRVHTGGDADRSARDVSAKAYTVGNNIVFGAGHYALGSMAGQWLLAHELTHVVQQTGGSQDKPVQMESLAIQRKLELRPPGRGEASAFDRAQELIDRLNTISPAIQYEIKGQELLYTVNDATALTHFDTLMKGFIDRAELVPMRLITGKGYVGGSPLFADSFTNAYVDLDDLLADDIYSFQSDLLHFLTERFQVKNYDRLIGTNFFAQFPKAHRAGKDAEAAQLKALFNDPSIAFLYEEAKPNNTWVNAFKSKDHGYRVFQVVRNTNREVAGGEMWVQKLDGKRVSIDDFRKERAAVAP